MSIESHVVFKELPTLRYRSKAKPASDFFSFAFTKKQNINP